jgi:hypothetical protein
MILVGASGSREGAAEDRIRLEIDVVRDKYFAAFAAATPLARLPHR